ncbi:LOW QUALITY PROTEIN: uroporphyrinogen decarboxylase 1 [Populus alba x Populus x berolinensis]|nr:LOW QUALITY PROTEIN: uroporphyrinogen decarboxylase 1 [Populus alba x Populus x berolinensis]
MAVYRKLAEKYPSFRERSETTDLIVEISLQPWEAFQPDGVIIFSDILTPLPAFGVPFDIEEVRGPVKGHAAFLGFVGAPWTIATYIVEGRTTRTYTTIKSMCHTARQVLRALLSHLTKAISDCIVFQSGAHCIQIFDSWGGQLPPDMWDCWSKPYIEEIVSTVRSKCPKTPLVLYINGNGGLLERMKGTGVDVIGLDWTVAMADGRKRLGSGISVQGNVDPAYLFSPLLELTDEIQRVVRCAGPRGHILNLGHGVLVGTPEEAVAHFFEVARSLEFSTPQSHVVEEPKLVLLLWHIFLLSVTEMRLSMDGKRVEDVKIRCMGASNAFRCDSLKSNGECIHGSADDGPKAPLFRHSHQLHRTKIGHIRLTLHASLSLSTAT